MPKITTFCVVAALLIAAPVYAIDTAPPDPVEDLIVTASADATLTLAWTAPGDDGRSGTASQYDVRMSESPIIEGQEISAPVVGGEPAPVPGGERQTMVFTELAPSTKYWFVLRAQDRRGNVSGFSNIAQGETQFDTTGPRISEVQVTERAPTSVRIGWRTDEPSTSELRYGETTAYGGVALASGRVTTHSLFVGGLTPGTTYHYQLMAVDQLGNTAKSEDMTFATLGASAAAASSQTIGLPAPAVPTLYTPPPAEVEGSISVTPATINLKSRSTWMVAVLRLPNSARDGMQFESLLINGRVAPSQQFTAFTQTVLTRYGTLWMRFARADIAALAPPETDSLVLTLAGTTAAGSFRASQTLKVLNNISREAWERQLEARQAKFVTDKEKRAAELQKKIDELKKTLAALELQLQRVGAEEFIW